MAGSFAEWTRLAEVVRWPIVAFLVLLFLWTDRGRRLLRPILRRVSKLSGAGFTVELTAEAATRTKADVEGELSEYARALNTELERLAHQHDVRPGLKRLVDGVFGQQRPTGLRTTVYIWDPLFAETVVQLVNYYPGRRGGAGRRFASRFGVVGRAFRSEEMQHEAKVPTDQKTLIALWGMDDEQAADAGAGQQSFLCEILRHEQVLVGVLYMDAKEPNAFGALVTADGGQSRLDDRVETRALAARVDVVRKAVAELGPALNLMGRS